MEREIPIVENATMQKQNVRIFDILLFGPILIYIGWSGKINDTIRAILILMGIGTIAYNGYYFFKYKQ